MKTLRPGRRRQAPAPYTKRHKHPYDYSPMYKRFPWLKFGMSGFAVGVPSGGRDERR